MTQFEKLIESTNKGLATVGLTLSEFGKAEMLKRFHKKESEGGYSMYWKTLP